MRLLFIILFFISIYILNSQTNGFHREYFIQNSITSVCRDVIEAPNGNIVLIGLSSDTLNGNFFNQLTVAGIDSYGNLLWTKKYGNKKFEHLDNTLVTRCIFKDASGFYYTGSVRDSNNLILGVLIKFNFNGDTIWQRKFYDSSFDVIPQSINQSIDNGYLITGFLQKTGPQPIIIIKTNNNGVELWRKNIISSNGINPVHDGRKIIQDPLSKKMLIAGYQYIGTKIYSSILFTDSLANKISQISFSGAAGGILSDLIQTNDGNFITVGMEDQGNNLGSTPRFKGHIIKFDLTGTIIWQNKFDTLATFNDLGTVSELPNGDLILGGHLDTMQNHNLNSQIMFRLIKLNQNGGSIFKKYFPVSNIFDSEKIRSINLGSNSRLLITTELLYHSNPRPYHLRVTDMNGCDTASVLCQGVGIEEINTSKEYISIYPNPFNSYISIKSFDEILNVNVFDVTGKIVSQTSVAEKFDVSINSFHFDSGLYFIRIETKHASSKYFKLIKP